MVITTTQPYRDLRDARFPGPLVEVLPKASINQLRSNSAFSYGKQGLVPSLQDTFVVAGGKFGIRRRLFPCHCEDRATKPDSARK